MNSTPFWEDCYRDDAVTTFGEPSVEIVGLAETLPKGTTVLDMGCGEGRNAIPLAKHGSLIDAFDCSSLAIAKLKRLASRQRTDVNAWCQRLEDYSFHRRYDCIIAHGVLHHLETNRWRQALDAMKEWTTPGGVHVICVFTDAAPVPDDLAPFVKGLFPEGKLFEIYSDWRLELAKSYVFEDEHPGGIQHTHAANKVVAFKPEA